MHASPHFELQPSQPSIPLCPFQKSVLTLNRDVKVSCYILSCKFVRSLLHNPIYLVAYYENMSAPSSSTASSAAGVNAVCGSLLALSVVTLGLRFYTRTLQKLSTGFDDWILIPCVVGSSLLWKEFKQFFATANR